MKFKELEEASDEEQDLFLEQISDNIDIIHAEIYGTQNNMNIHCLETLQELQSYEVQYGHTGIYEIIKDILKENI